MIIFINPGGIACTPEIVEVLSTHVTLKDVYKIFERPSYYLDNWVVKLQEALLQQEEALLDRSSSYAISLERIGLGVRYNPCSNGLRGYEIINGRCCILEAAAIYSADPHSVVNTEMWNNLKSYTESVRKRKNE